MERNEHHEVNETNWQQVNISHTFIPIGAEIKFRRNKRGDRIKSIVKGISFVLIASVSGGVTGAYIVQKKLQDRPYFQYSTPIFQSKDYESKNSDLWRNSINNVAETVGPAIVGISNTEESFFGDIKQSGGSGVIFDPNGYIVTNYHVIQGADKVLVKLYSNNTPFTAKFVGADATADLAIIKIDAQNLPAARFGDSSKVKVGDTAIAIGNPLGDEFAGTVTSGIISAVNRKFQSGKTGYKLLQTDAAINPGNSGGALCNEAGEVIGITSLRIQQDVNDEGIQGMGFAISINEVSNAVNKIMDSVKKNSSQTLNSNNMKTEFGIIGGLTKLDAYGNQKGIDVYGTQKGIYVQEVISEGAAEAAGIKRMDIIVEVDGQKLKNDGDFNDILNQHKAGDTITCKIWRNGKEISPVEVTLKEKKDK